MKRKIIFSLTPLIIVLLVTEGISYFYFKDDNYKVKFDNTANYLTINNAPVQDEKLSWDSNSIVIRHNDIEYDPDYTAYYNIAGKKEIPDFFPKARSIVVYPEDISTEERVIFVVGGSAAFGYNHHYSKTFSALLEKSMEGTKVVNAAQPGWGSGSLVPVVKRITDSYDPDMIILFMGNNEWIRWFPIEQNLSTILYWKFANVFKNSYALSFLMYRSLMYKSENYSSPEDNRLSKIDFHPGKEGLTGYKYGLEHPITKYTEFDYGAWWETKEQFINNFENNLLEMINYCKSGEVDVILMTTPYNYRLSPFWSSPQPLYQHQENREKVDSLFNAIVFYIDQEKFEDAKFLVDQAIEFEPNIGTFYYLQGVIYEGLNDHFEAEYAYSQSRELMVGDLGSILSFNNVIRKVSEKTNTPLIDLVSIFDDYGHAIGRFYNQDLIDDDCHSNIKGHQIITKSILELLCIDNT